MKVSWTCVLGPVRRFICSHAPASLMPWRADTEESSTNPSPNTRRTIFTVRGDPGTERREIIAERLRERQEAAGSGLRS
jgi:hypothetical protein